MAMKRNKYSVAVATKWTVGELRQWFLSDKDIMEGMDFDLTQEGYQVTFY